MVHLHVHAFKSMFFYIIKAFKKVSYFDHIIMRTNPVHVQCALNLHIQCVHVDYLHVHVHGIHTHVLKYNLYFFCIVCVCAYHMYVFVCLCMGGGGGVV